MQAIHWERLIATRGFEKRVLHRFVFFIETRIEVKHRYRYMCKSPFSATVHQVKPYLHPEKFELFISVLVFVGGIPPSFDHTLAACAVKPNLTTKKN